MPLVAFFEYGAIVTGFLLVCLAARALIHYYLQLAVEVAVVALSYYLPSDLKGIESDENVKEPKAEDLQKIIAARLADLRQRLSEAISNYTKTQGDIRQIVVDDIKQNIAKCKDQRKSRNEAITQVNILQLKVENKREKRVELENNHKIINNEIQEKEQERERVDCIVRKNVYEASQMDKQIEKLQEDWTIPETEDDLANAMEEKEKLEKTIIQLKAERNKIDEKISAFKAARDQLQYEMKVIDTEIEEYEKERSNLNGKIAKTGEDILKYHRSIKISLDKLLNQYQREMEQLYKEIEQSEIDHFERYKSTIYHCRNKYCIDELNKLVERREAFRKKLADLKADYVLFH